MTLLWVFHESRASPTGLSWVCKTGPWVTLWVSTTGSFVPDASAIGVPGRFYELP